MPIINYVGLALLFFSILYSGRQIGLFIRLTRSMGKLIHPISPSRAQKKLLLGAAVIFVVLLVMVTYNYVSKGIGLGVTYTTLVAVVIYSTGRFTSKVTQMREQGILGHLNDIAYKDIRSYKFDQMGARNTLTFKLKDNREFVTLVGKDDISGLEGLLKGKL